ncbi:MAG: hypothetical protein R3E95_17725 [Thiolinea sp.]
MLFDGEDVTRLPTEKRHIAQVFQFPVVYDTMTVYDNLAFPLRNRKHDKQTIHERVTRIAEMLEMSDVLKKKARGLDGGCQAEDFPGARAGAGKCGSHPV